MSTPDEIRTAGGGQTVREMIDAELGRRQSLAVRAAAAHAAKRHGDAVVGVLFYGSCLRTGQLDDRLLDFYLIVNSYEAAYGSRLLALANRILPPNVFYDECTHRGVRLRCKYNVISLVDFRHRTRRSYPGVSVWARFAQPAAFADGPKPADSEAIAQAIAEAVLTALASTLPLCRMGDDSAAVWTRLFSLTYAAELRSEEVGKGREIYEMDRERYDRLFAPALEELGVRLKTRESDGCPVLAEDPPAATRDAARRAWRHRRRRGKATSLLRLAKAAFTFDGGIDYLAWKIARHSGVTIAISPWQRRHPVIAGLLLFFRLRRRGAFR